ncbi:MAG: shikimate kinase [Enterococcus sp.]
MKENLVLIGFMGSGKSTIGACLAKKLQKKWLDLDQLFIQNYGAIDQFFDKHGEKAFRKIEEELLDEALQATDGIISTGGGIVLSAKNRQQLKQSVVVFLHADSAELFRRVKQDQENQRPLARQSEEAFQTLYQKRYPFYETCQTKQINTTNRTPEDICEEITQKLFSIGSKKN